MFKCWNQLVQMKLFENMNLCAITALKGTPMHCKVNSPLWCKCFIVLMIPRLRFLKGAVNDKMFEYVLSFCLLILFRNIWNFFNKVFAMTMKRV